MPSLIVVEGPNRGAIHALRPDASRIGRDPDNEVPVLDERASRVHARVVVEGREHVLEDCASTNGTRLNGVRCERAPLRSGDVLRIGGVSLLFVDDEDEAGPGALPPAHGSTLLVPLEAAREGRPRRAVAAPPPPLDLIGDSSAMQALQRQVFRVASTGATVLVSGESGTGKELVARALHRNSPRRRGPFLALNAATLRGELLESELFGHEKGAFTGALARRKGAFELADRGTLFLDEVGELPLASQAALLRVLEGHGFTRLGGGEPLRPDVRVVAATHRDLAAEVRAGRFREDLAYRLEVVRLELPPLRERAGDVPLLAEHFLAAARRRIATCARRFAPEALAALEAYPFPGNVRELENLIERVAIFAEHEVVTPCDLPPPVRGAAPRAPAPEAPSDEGPFPTLREVERAHVLRALERAGWNKTRAAELLGIDRVTLYRRIARDGLEPA